MGDIKRDQLKVPDSDKVQQSGRFELYDGVIIALSQAFCHNGHPLIDETNPRFLGYPGITVEVSANGNSEVLIISPVHGHHDRIGGNGISNGTQCEVACPQCHEALPTYEEACACGTGKLRVMHLTPALDKGDHVLVCDVWGCHRSRVVDRWELLSEFVDE